MTSWKIALVAAVLVSTPVTSQRSVDPVEAELHRRFDAAVARIDPAWREEFFRPSSVAGRSSAKRWQRGDTTLDIRYYLHDTEEEASRVAQHASRAAVPYTPVSGYGDEAYLSARGLGPGTALVVRKGTTVLQIFSVDGGAVLRFARELLGEIEEAQRHGLVR